MGFSFEVTSDMIIRLIPFIKNTLFISFISFGLAIALATILAMIKHFKVPILRQFVDLYISFFRSTPTIAQIFLVFFGLPSIFPIFRGISPLLTLIVVLGMSQASYSAETIRSSLLAIDLGQYEAALSLSMTNSQIMRRIVFPQAFRVALPNFFNSFVGLVKGTSLGFTVGVIELMSMSKILGNKTFAIIESYVSVLVIYWVIVVVLERINKKLEGRISIPYND